MKRPGWDGGRYEKDAVEAYIDCLSSAIMKDEYIELIDVAGSLGSHRR